MKKNTAILLAFFCLATACKKDPADNPIDNPANDTTPAATIQEGAIDALFSVSDTRQVRFSKGNLQYQATTATWRFAERQYDRIGLDNENISQHYAGWIDLFGWATSGFDCGNTYYMPYDHALLDDYDRGDGYGPLPSRDYDLVGQYAKCDWGVYNAISNGGNKAGLWRTLTAEEWGYVATARDNARQKLGVASIEGINGLVLLPDSWELPEGCSFNPGMAEEDSREHFALQNSYTAAQWAKMEKNGAVFLPAAGGREDTEVVFVNEMGRYWSVTRCTGTNYFDEWCALTLYFDSKLLLPADHNNPRERGRAVRLVCDAQD